MFLQAAQHSLETGEIVSSDPLPSIPGARRVTYFAATNQDGVGEAITMRAGVYVDLLSIFSAATGNAHAHLPRQRRTARRGPARGDGTGAGWDHDHHAVRRPDGPAARRAPRSAPSDWPWSSSPSRRGPWPRRACCGGAVWRRRPQRRVRRCTMLVRPRQPATRLTISANSAGDVTGSRWPESRQMTSTGGGSRCTMTCCISGLIGRSLSFST